MPTKTVRYTCAIEGYEDSWIDLAAKWTRDDERELLAYDSDIARLPMLQRRCTAVHLVDGDTVISDVDKLTNEGLEHVDLVLWGFVTTVLVMQWREMRTLGDFAKRVSPATSGPTN